MTTAPTPPPPTPEGLKVEAQELTDDLKEAKQEAAAARREGDDARADRIEAAMTETRKELDEIKSMLKGLTERPFHPAPGDGETPPPPAGTETPAAGTETPPAGTETPPAEDKPKKGHWLYGKRWSEE